MSLCLTEEQTMLQNSVTDYFASASPVTQMRALRDSDDPKGMSPDVWRGTSEMGLTSILIPEAEGGLGLGHVEIGIVQEQIGRNIVLTPFLGTAVGAVTALRAASAEARASWLPRIAAGDAIAALAIDEGSRHDPDLTALTARKVGSGYRLDGNKRFVPLGHVADLLIVLARLDSPTGALALFLVEPGAAGMTIATDRLVDSSIAAHIAFDGVEVAAGALIGSGEVVDAVLDASRVAVSAELLGLAMAITDRTMTYLRERKQFGVLIGSFQALQHRAAALYSELEIARGAVRKAQQALDEQHEDRARHAMVAKAITSSVANLAMREGVQMHGGIGMTDEHDAGLYMKRARVLAELLGSAPFHANRLALAEGY